MNESTAQVQAESEAPSIDRGSLRASIFNSKNKQRKRRPLSIFGIQVEILQPSVREVLAMGDVDNKDVLAKVLIDQAVVPGTDDRIFDPADKDAIMDFPADEWIGELTDIIQELSGTKQDEQGKG